MKFIALVVALLLVPLAAYSKRGKVELDKATEIARNANERLANNPSLPPEETARLQREKAEAVEKIETIANSDPKDTETQLDVSKSLASVSEAPRAIPYAERGLKLAEAANDPKLVREALLTGSEVYYKAGNYELARSRVERVLRDNPKDKDALALYMQVKGRGAATGSSAYGLQPGSGAGGASKSSAGSAAPPPAAEAPRPAVAMTSASALEAQKQIALGWSKMKLDPQAALKHFEAAITADPKGAATRVQRSKARLEAGDARGALGDANDAVALAPGLGEGYAARAEAHRALGLAEADLLADYERAASLDGRFAKAYEEVLTRTGAPARAAGEAAKDKDASGAGSAPASYGPLSLLRRSPNFWGVFAFACAMLAAAAGIVVPPLLRRRRSDEDGSPPR